VKPLPHRSHPPACALMVEEVLFSGAVICLAVALFSAVVNFGGFVSGDAAAVAGYVYLIATGLFVVIAVVVILDLELPDDIRGLFVRSAQDISEQRTGPDVRHTRMT
jgi:hypothetical protein